MEFQEKVLKLVSKIPEGKVTTYKKIAQALGKPKSYRAVGNALAKNPNPIDIPCHRVIKSNGKVGKYGRGTKKKKEILKQEGIEIESGEINLGKYLFSDF